MSLNQWKPKNNYSVCLRETILQPWDCLLSPIVMDGKDEDGSQLLKLVNNSWRENKGNHYREGGLDMWS